MKGETYATAKKLSQEPLDNCRGVVGQPPPHKDGEMFFRGMGPNLISLLVTFPTVPHTEITEKSETIYSEVKWENVRKLKAYVEEMANAGQISGSANI